jgi:hypothetical protein
MSAKESLRVPVRLHGSEKWGALAYLVSGTQAIDFVGESVKLFDEKFSFAGGHRVRRYRAKKSVHFTICTEMLGAIELDISQVPPGTIPARRPQNPVGR